MLRRTVAALLVFWAASPAGSAEDKPAPVTAWQLRARFAQHPAGKDLERLRARVQATFGKRALETGTARPLVEEGLVVWAIAVTPEQAKAGVVPKVVINKGQRRADMQALGSGSDLFILYADLPNFTELFYEYDVSGRRTGAGRVQVEYYNPDPDSLVRGNVPRGKLTKHTWKSKIFAGTVRNYYVYAPARYDPKGPPACVMVFQDGGLYLSSVLRTNVTLDNLIHKKEIPVMIGLFIDPGVIPAKDGGRPVANRSVEYDTLSDKYARFLRDEMLPEVGKTYRLRTDAASRAICGISSGGICAFTVAWEMPDQFSKVLSHVGSFTNIRGGHVYPPLIRKTPRKDIRVFLQDGRRDLDNEYGNWPLANQEMAAALRFRGYDLRFVMDEGFHTGLYAGAHLPSMLRWLWRDYKAPEKEKEGSER
jgi:enterochelin esterase family protein